MIGSSTLFIKRNNRYHVLVIQNFLTFGDFVARYCRKNKISLFEYFKRLVESREHGYSAKDISRQKINDIISSTNCCSPQNEGYNKFCGDDYGLVDFDSKSFGVFLDRKFSSFCVQTVNKVLTGSLARKKER